MVASLYQPENLDLRYKELLEKAKDIFIDITSNEIDIVKKRQEIKLPAPPGMNLELKELLHQNYVLRVELPL